MRPAREAPFADNSRVVTSNRNNEIRVYLHVDRVRSPIYGLFLSLIQGVHSFSKISAALNSSWADIWKLQHLYEGRSWQWGVVSQSMSSTSDPAPVSGWKGAGATWKYNNGFHGVGAQQDGDIENEGRRAKARVGQQRSRE